MSGRELVGWRRVGYHCMARGQSVTFSGFIADLSSGQSQSVNVTAISADLKADGGFSSHRAFPLSVQRDGLARLLFLLSTSGPARDA